MSKADKKVKVAPEVAADIPQRDPVEAPAVASRPVRKESDKIVIVLKDGTERTYSAFTHGKPWRALAANFAEANGIEIE